MNIYQNDKNVDIFVKTHEAAKISNAKDSSGSGSTAANSGLAITATKIVLLSTMMMKKVILLLV